MKRHHQLAVVGVRHEHVAIMIGSFLNAGSVHEAIMALEEFALVSFAFADEFSNAFEFGFIAADPRTRPEKIVECQLYDCA